MATPKALVFSKNAQKAADAAPLTAGTVTTAASAPDSTPDTAASAAGTAVTAPSTNSESKLVMETGEVLKAIIESAPNYCPNVTMASISSPASLTEIQKRHKEGIIVFKMLALENKTTYICTQYTSESVLKNEFDFRTAQKSELLYVEITTHETQILNRNQNFISGETETVVRANSVLMQNKDGTLKIEKRALTAEEWEDSFNAADTNRCCVM